jgi:hypothetical protein
MRRALAVALCLIAGVGSTAWGQEPAPAATEERTVLQTPPLDAARLRMPRAMQYDVMVSSDSGTRHVGWFTVWIYDVVFAGRPAWEISERRESHAPFPVRVSQDSLILSRDLLQPLRWEAAAGDAKIVAAFANDSVYGGATAPASRITFTVAAPPALVTSEGSLDVTLRASPLAPGWIAEVPMLVADLGGARIVPLHLAVERDEVVDVPAGRFDAWVVTASAGGSGRTIWVDKRSGVVVKTLESPPYMPGMTVERSLAALY